MKLTKSAVRTVRANTKGIDYIVGDLHGCYDKLMQKLGSINFDFSKDRLFAVGDLTDRGPDSIKCIDLLSKPWFYTVRGNHDQFAIDYSKGNLDRNNYISQGGYWFVDLSREDQEYIAEKLDKLPWVIQLKTAAGTIGIVHAQPVKIDGKYNWKRFIKGIKEDEQMHNWTSVRERCTWDRFIAYDADELQENIKGVYAVVAGHNTVPKPVNYKNFYCLDTGACYNAEEAGYGYLTLLRADTLEFI